MKSFESTKRLIEAKTLRREFESMNKLIEIENLRQELVRKIMEFTGLEVDDFDVDVTFSECDELTAEAEELGWHSGRYGDSVWHTSKEPTAGEVTVFVESEAS